MQIFNVNEVSNWLVGTSTRRRCLASPAPRGNYGKCKPVIQYGPGRQVVARHPSIQDAAASVGIGESSIRKALKGSRIYAAGWKWSFDKTKAI